MRLKNWVLNGLLLLLTTACVNTPIRLPASFKPRYDGNIVTALHSAAINGILFQFNDSVFRDVAFQQVDRCRKTETPEWSKTFLQLLDTLNKNPQYYMKFHMVEFKRGDHAKAEIVKDIDGLSTLTISYAKKEVRDHVTASTVMPCGDSVSDNLGKEIVTATVEWPTQADLVSVLDSAAAKSKIARFDFNTDFLAYLADRQTILKINPEVAFERTFEGNYFLKGWLQEMAEELKDPKTNLDFLNYWLKEISLKSSQAHQIEFFGLHPENPVSYGIEIDSAGKFARKINNLQDPTYVFMSYGQTNGDYVYDGLQDLNDCLRQLTGIYTNPLEMGGSLESDPDGFLAPGYSCQPKED